MPTREAVNKSLALHVLTKALGLLVLHDSVVGRDAWSTTSTPQVLNDALG